MYVRQAIELRVLLLLLLLLLEAQLQRNNRFSVAAPRLWNSLPLNCQAAPSINTFKTRFKTFLFASA